jgi:drug/metabolite transporter (DMT)-like permease
MWEALALTAALCQVLRNTVMKRLGHELDEYMAVWGRFTFLLPFAAIFVLWHGAPVIKPGFVWACLLFALAVGVLIFGERQKVREIAPGAAVMLAGVVLLSLAA